MSTRERKAHLDINEQRKSLNRLEEDIERELAELQSLNKSTETMRKKFKYKLSEATNRDEYSSSYPTTFQNKQEQINTENKAGSDAYVSLGNLEMNNVQSKDARSLGAQSNPQRDQGIINESSKDSKSKLSESNNNLPKDIMDIVKQLEINGPPKSNPPNLFKPTDQNNKQTTDSRPSRTQASQDKKSSASQKKLTTQPATTETKEITNKKRPSLTPSRSTGLSQNANQNRKLNPNTKDTEDTRDENDLTRNQITLEQTDTSINQYISLYQREYPDRHANVTKTPPSRAKSQNAVYRTTDQSPGMDQSCKFTSRNELSQRNERIMANKNDTERSLGSFHPQINKKSLEMASKMGDPFERLASISAERQKQSKKKAQKEMDRDLTFQPKINKSSQVLDENFKNNMFNGDQLYRWDQLYLMKDKYNIGKQMKKLEIEKQNLENDECTFQPNTLNSKYNLHRSQNSTIAERSKMWEEQKQQKILKEKQENVDKELEGCTFKPHVQNTKNSKKDFAQFPNASIDGLDVGLAIPGADRHFERIEKAARLKREKENILNQNQGATWQYKLTVPKEPKLGRQPLQNQSSLRNLNSLSPMHVSTAVSSIYESKRERAHQEDFDHFSSYRQQASKSPIASNKIPKNNRSVYVEVEQEVEEQFTNAIAQLHLELHQIRF